MSSSKIKIVFQERDGRSSALPGAALGRYFFGGSRSITAISEAKRFSSRATLFLPKKYLAILEAIIFIKTYIKYLIRTEISRAIT